jgi:hypothetical protein
MSRNPWRTVVSDPLSGPNNGARQIRPRRYTPLCGSLFGNVTWLAVSTPIQAARTAPPFNTGPPPLIHRWTGICINAVAGPNGPVRGQDEQRMIDPLTLPKYKVGKDVSPWPGVKIARAQEHLNALASRVGLWVATQPFSTVGNLADDQLSWSLRLIVTAPPPILEWATDLGDCVHNLRSALDAAVWDFCTLGGREPVSPTQIQFPIVTQLDRWASDAARRLAGASDDVIERIRIVQPMMRSDTERSGDPLLLLQHLSNLDKHRSSISLSLTPDEVHANFGVDFGSEDVAGRNVPPQVAVFTPNLEHDAVLVEYRAKDPIVKTTGGFGVSLTPKVETPQGTQPLFPTVQNLIKYVGTVLSVMYEGAIREE